jgi:hypothetical protein
VEAGTWIALGALAVTVGSVLWARRGQTENLSLAQLVAANRALSDRVDRVEEELEDAREQLEECTKREKRLDLRDNERLRRIIRLEDALTARGIALPEP